MDRTDEEKVKRIAQIYEEIDISNICLDYEEETRNLLNMHINYLRNFQLNIFYTYSLHHIVKSDGKINCTRY